MVATACRHGSGQKHDLTMDWPRVKVCHVSGTFDSGKHRKIVSTDVRSLAREWISVHIPHASRGPLSADEEELEASHIEAPEEDEVALSIPPQLPSIAVDFSGSFESGRSTPPVQVRTGLRVHRLTYLLGVWEAAAPAARAYALKVAAQELEADGDLEILHLCGCGLCSADAKDDGCVEPSHLRAGSKKENALHKEYHSVLSQISARDYVSVRAAIRNDCKGGHDLL